MLYFQPSKMKLVLVICQFEIIKNKYFDPENVQVYLEKNFKILIFDS